VHREADKNPLAQSSDQLIKTVISNGTTKLTGLADPPFQLSHPPGVTNSLSGPQRNQIG
jgi:hypothetical protein